MSMINTKDILETIKMIEEEHLDIRTITMGISLRDLAADDINVLADKIYDKVTRRAGAEVDWYIKAEDIVLKKGAAMNPQTPKKDVPPVK